jgi:hypothetical protein
MSATDASSSKSLIASQAKGVWCACFLPSGVDWHCLLFATAPSCPGGCSALRTSVAETALALHWQQALALQLANSAYCLRLLPYATKGELLTWAHLLCC